MFIRISVNVSRRFMYLVQVVLLSSLFFHSSFLEAEDGHLSIYAIQKPIAVQLGSIKTTISEKNNVVRPIFIPYDKGNVQFNLRQQSLVTGRPIDINGQEYLMVPFSGAVPDDIRINDKDLVFLVPKEGAHTSKLNPLDNFYKPAVAEKNLTSRILKEEDTVVYPNVTPYEGIFLTSSPDFDEADCHSADVINKDCVAKIGRTDKLVVKKAILTHASGSPLGENAKQPIQLVYQVQTEARFKKCGHDKSKTPDEDCKIITQPITAWLPADKTVDFQRKIDPIESEKVALGIAQARVFQKLKHHFGKEELLVPDSSEQPSKKAQGSTIPAPKCLPELLQKSGINAPLAEALEKAANLHIDDRLLGQCLGQDFIKRVKDETSKQIRWESDQRHRLKNELQEARKKFKAKGAKTGSPQESLIHKLDRDLLSLPDKSKEMLKAKLDNEAQNPFDKYVRKYWMDQEAKGNTGGIPYEKMLSIDALARTLYGEMRRKQCTRDTTAYMSATGRGLLTRAAMIKKKGGQVENFLNPDYLRNLALTDPQKSTSDIESLDASQLPSVSKEQAATNIKKQSLFKILPYILSSNEQVTSWEPYDPNVVHNLCPKPVGEDEKNSWEIAKAVAKDIVLNTQDFLKRTRQLDSAVLYSSGENFVPTWANNPGVNLIEGAKIHAFVLDGKTNEVAFDTVEIRDGSCIKLYNVDRYQKILEEINASPKRYYSRDLRERQRYH